MVYKIDAQADLTHAEEFRNNPIARHSPGLRRLLNVMRYDPSGRQVILICRQPFRSWVLGEMPPSRTDPILIERDRVFTSIAEAEWEIFKRRWKKITGKTLQGELSDQAKT